MHTTQNPATELLRQLAELRLPLDGSARDSLRTAVADYVDQTKRLGWAPERVLVGVKRVAHEAGLRPSTRIVLTAASHGLNEKDALLLDLIGWSIDRYYDPSG